MQGKQPGDRGETPPKQRMSEVHAGPETLWQSLAKRRKLTHVAGHTLQLILLLIRQGFHL